MDTNGVQKITSLLVAALIPLSTQANYQESTNLDETIRAHHARELLGNQAFKTTYYQDQFNLPESADDMVYSIATHRLKGHWKPFSRQIARTILREAKKYQFDPVFLAAVIDNESSFKPLAKGSHGEVGLMQLRKETAQWVSKKFDMKWQGAKSLKDPKFNIEIGAAYLSYLRDHFDSNSRLYLAAYNMGVRNVNHALRHRIQPRDYAFRVMVRYKKFYNQSFKQENLKLARSLAATSELFGHEILDTVN